MAFTYGDTHPVQRHRVTYIRATVWEPAQIPDNLLVFGTSNINKVTTGVAATGLIEALAASPAFVKIGEFRKGRGFKTEDGLMGERDKTQRRHTKKLVYDGIVTEITPAVAAGDGCLEYLESLDNSDVDICEFDPVTLEVHIRYGMRLKINEDLGSDEQGVELHAEVEVSTAQTMSYFKEDYKLASYS